VYDVFLPLISEQLEALCAVQRGGFFFIFFDVPFSFFCRAPRTGVATYHACRTKRNVKQVARQDPRDDSMIPCCVLGFMRGRRVKPVYFLDCISLLMLHLSQHVSFVLLSQVRQISDVVFILVFALGFNWQLVSVKTP
jgi:hypothetical protein